MKTKLPKKYSDTVLYVTDDSRECCLDTAFLLTPLSVKYIDNAKEAGALIKADELASYFDFSSIKIIGITGTNGKTTTAAAIYSMLLDLGYKVAMQGTRGFFINGERQENKSLTTPMQLGNFMHIQEAINMGCEFFVTEVSSHAIVQKRIEGLNFALKIFTNLTQDHLDFHKTYEDYKDAKLSFLKNGNILFNIDDDAAINIKGTSYGLEKNSDYKVSAFSENNGLMFVLNSKSEQCSFSSDMVGRFNIYNLTAAIAAVQILTNKKLQEFTEPIEQFGGVEGRMQVVSNEPLIVVDFAHTPDGIARALDALKSKDLIVVFGAGGDRDATKRPLMAKEVAMRSRVMIVTSDNPRSENPETIIEQILLGVPNNYQGRVFIEPNRKEAIKEAINMQNSNYAVVILGKGDETYQEIAGQKLPFDDREVVKEILRQI